MSSAPAEPQKSLYQLHADMRAARTTLTEARLEVHKARTKTITAANAAARAEQVFNDAVTALLAAPVGLDDHLDALTCAMAPEPPDPVCVLRELAGRARKQLGDERTALLINRLASELEYPYLADKYHDVAEKGLAAWLAHYDELLAKLAATPAPAPAV